MNLKGGGGQLADKEGDGEQMCGMVTGTGVSERLPSTHPVTTSGHGTDRRAGFVAEGSEQGTKSLVVFRLRWWKEGFISMINRNFVRSHPQKTADSLIPKAFFGSSNSPNLCIDVLYYMSYVI